MQHATLQTSKPPRPPVVHGLPLVGNILPLMRDAFDFFFNTHLRVGPAFQVRVLGNTFTVLAGPAAHALMSANDGRLSTWQVWEGIITEFGGRKLMAMVDGERLAQYRRVMRPGMSRAIIMDDVPTVLSLIDRALDAYTPGQDIPVVRFCQEVISNQLGVLSLGMPAGEYLDDFMVYWSTILQVRLIKAWPESRLDTAAYRHARARVEEMLRDVADKAERGEIKDGARNFATDIVQAAREHPDVFDDREKLFHLIVPYIAGLDTVANTVAYLLYHVLTDADLLAKVRAEVDEAFADGPPTHVHLRRMVWLNAASMETMRLYPIAATLTRYAAEDFTFEGYHIPKGERLMIIPSGAHMDPAYYQEPHRFDAARFLEPRSEHKQHKGIYAPYGAGEHSCMGASMADVQVPLTVAALLHVADLSVDTKAYTLKKVYNPSMSPGPSFKMRLVALRTPQHL